jgi:hypothetical protein
MSDCRPIHLAVDVVFLVCENALRLLNGTEHARVDRSQVSHCMSCSIEMEPCDFVSLAPFQAGTSWFLSRFRLRSIFLRPCKTAGRDPMTAIAGEHHLNIKPKGIKW